MLKEKWKTLENLVKKYGERNKYILNNKSLIPKPNCVNLYRWYHSENGATENLGDYLAEIIVDYMLSLKKIDRNKYIAHRKNLYTVGSILGTGMCNATVWGSGYIDKYIVGSTYKKILPKLRQLDIRAVRGPLTREVLLSAGYTCPEIYGDPAILLPLIYTPNTPPDLPKDDYKIVRHFTDNTECQNIISVLTKDYRNFVDQIVTSKKIISSSLHGIIIAESYGIPAVLYMPECVKEKEFKYRDYYYSTGRMSFPIAKTLEEAIKITPCDVPDMRILQKNLIDCFPYDLWK